RPLAVFKNFLKIMLDGSTQKTWISLWHGRLRSIKRPPLRPSSCIGLAIKTIRVGSEPLPQTSAYQNAKSMAGTLGSLGVQVAKLIEMPDGGLWRTPDERPTTANPCGPWGMSHQMWRRRRHLAAATARLQTGAIIMADDAAKRIPINEVRQESGAHELAT